MMNTDQTSVISWEMKIYLYLYYFCCWNYVIQILCHGDISTPFILCVAFNQMSKIKNIEAHCSFTCSFTWVLLCHVAVIEFCNLVLHWLNSAILCYSDWILQSCVTLIDSAILRHCDWILQSCIAVTEFCNLALQWLNIAELCCSGWIFHNALSQRFDFAFFVFLWPNFSLSCCYYFVFNFFLIPNWA